MSDAFNSSFSLGNSQLSNFGFDAQFDVKSTEAGLLQMVTDTIASSQGGDGTTVSTAPGSVPKLAKPESTSRNSGINSLISFGTATKKFVDQFNNFSKQFTYDQGEQQEKPSNFLDSVQQQLSKLSKQQMADLGDKPPEELEAMVMYAVINPKADLPAPIKALAAQITAQAEESSGSQLTSMDRITFNQTIDEGYHVFFQKALENSGLSAADQNKVAFAHFMPQYADSLPSNLKAVLQQSEAASKAELQKSMGVPASWTPPNDSKTFEAEQGLTYQHQVCDKLLEMRNNGQISQEQYNELRTLFFDPGANTPHAATLLPMLKQVAGEQLKTMQKDVGFPDGYTPPISDTSWNNMLTGAYYQTCQQSIGNQSPPLSSNDQARLLAALTSPQARQTLSPALKNTLQSIEMEASSSIKQTYALPDTWVPSTSALNAIGKSSPLESLPTRVVNNAIDQMQERINIATKMLDSPAVKAILTPEVANDYKNFLKAVGMALNEFREANYTASVRDGEVGHILNNIQHEAKTDQLAKQRKSMLEIQEKMKKMATMGPVMMAIVMVIMAIIMALLVAATMGGAAPAAAAIMGAVQSAIQSATTGAMAAATAAVSAAVEAATSAGGAAAAVATASETITEAAMSAVTSEGVMTAITSAATAAFQAVADAGGTMAAAEAAAQAAAETVANAAAEAASTAACNVAGAAGAATPEEVAGALSSAAGEIQQAALDAAAAAQLPAAAAGETAGASFTLSTTYAAMVVTTATIGFIMTGMSMDTGQGSGLSELLKACHASKNVIQGFTMAAQVLGVVLMMGAGLAAVSSIPPGAATEAASRAISQAGQNICEKLANSGLGKMLGEDIQIALLKQADKFRLAASESTQKIGDTALHMDKLKDAEKVAKQEFEAMKSSLFKDANNASYKEIDKFVDRLHECAQNLSDLQKEQQILLDKSQAGRLTKAEQARLSELGEKLKEPERFFKELFDDNAELLAKCSDDPQSLKTTLKADAEEICLKVSEHSVPLNTTIQKMSNYIGAATEGADALAQLAQAAPKIKNTVIEKQITRIRIDIEADQVLMDKLVKAFKALIDKLLNSLKGFTGTISDINHLQQKMYQEASSTFSNACDAMRG